jgi:hypothetical protein
MQEAKVSNPREYEVIEFTNTTTFTFTPEMGSMYNGTPISGSGVGIAPGESIMLPYHVAHLLAKNLAKQALLREVPTKDAEGRTIEGSMWDEKKLEEVKGRFLKIMYTEEKPRALSDSEILLAKIEELNKWKESIESKGATNVEPSTTGYLDKAAVIAELEKRGIAHDKRQGKDALEKLLA